MSTVHSPLWSKGSFWDISYVVTCVVTVLKSCWRCICLTIPKVGHEVLVVWQTLETHGSIFLNPTALWICKGNSHNCGSCRCFLLVKCMHSFLIKVVVSSTLLSSCNFDSHRQCLHFQVYHQRSPLSSYHSSSYHFLQLFLLWSIVANIWEKTKINVHQNFSKTICGCEGLYVFLLNFRFLFLIMKVLG